MFIFFRFLQILPWLIYKDYLKTTKACLFFVADNLFSFCKKINYLYVGVLHDQVPIACGVAIGSVQFQVSFGGHCIKGQNTKQSAIYIKFLSFFAVS